MNTLRAVVPFLALNELGRMESVAQHRLGNLRGNDRFLLADYPPDLVGSSGVLLDRKTDRVLILGSLQPAERQIWAIERGFDLERPNRLVVTRVNDLSTAVEILRQSRQGGIPRPDVRAALERLPATFDVDLLGLLGMLDALPETLAFDYEVNP